MLKSRIARALVVAALAACAFSSGARAVSAQAAPQQQAKEAPASVSGRVTIEGRGAAGVAVGLMPSEFRSDRRAAARAKTDAEGNYRLAGVAPGRYHVVASAPGYVVGQAEAEAGWQSGTAVMLAAGESLEDVDFTLERGGVITGRVTDADGRPVVGEFVRLMNLDGEGRGRPPYDLRMWQTDDRGVYRLYGLSAGRYKVSVGVDASRGSGGFGRSDRGYYALTFHPDATQVNDAKVVEVSAGGEATDVDITLGLPLKTYRARGRVVHAATGQPAAGVTFGYSVVDRGSGVLVQSGGGMRSQTNARGEFEITGLLPGPYGAYAAGDEASGLYAEVVPFEIKAADVTGLEVKLRAGASLSGTVFVEGVTDRALLAQLFQQLIIHPGADPREGLAPLRYEAVRVNADGSFLINGLRPGRVSLGISSVVKGLAPVRLELNGAEQRDHVIDVAEGAHVAGVRLVFVYGTGKIRGQIVLRSGEQSATLPPGARLGVFARRPGQQRIVGGRGGDGEVDARGRFLIEGLPAGEVEVLVNVFGGLRGQARQLVNVTDGGETNVTITLDLSQSPPPPPRRAPPAGGNP